MKGKNQGSGKHEDKKTSERKGKKAMWALLILALVGGGIAAWFFLRPGKKGQVSISPPILVGDTIPAGPYRLDWPPQIQGDRPVLFMIFIDGLHAGVFERMLNQGELPNLAELAKELPSFHRRILSTFPSSTTPAIPELLTGLYSHHFVSVPDKIHSFDRARKEIYRYEFVKERWDGVLPNLFDLVSAHGGIVLSYFEGFFESAELNVDDEYYYLINAVANYSQRKIPLDYDNHLVERVIRQIIKDGKAPNLVFLRLSNVDVQGHFFGPFSPQYEEALKNADAYLGKLFKFTKEAVLPDGRSLFEMAHFMVFGDHGMEECRHFIDIDGLMESIGFHPLRTADLGSVIASALGAAMVDDYDIISVPGGSNITQLYVRARRGGKLLPWRKRPFYRQWREFPMADDRKIDLVGFLLAVDGIQFVMVPESENIYHVFSSEQGAATIWKAYDEQGRWLIAYLPEQNDKDPFAYLKHEQAAKLCCPGSKGYPAKECFHPVDEWLELTWDTPYPLAPFFVVKAFNGIGTERADMIITAKPGFGFMAKMKGNHGSMSKDCMWSAMLLAGKRVSEHAEEKLRLIDLFPALLEFFNLEGELQILGTEGKTYHIFTPAEPLSKTQENPETERE